MWLAQVGSERLDEIADPEKAIDRAFETYLKKAEQEAADPNTDKVVRA